MDFTVKDSGQRQQFKSGMVRDTTEAKIDYSLCFDGPMLQRWAAHLTKGARKYSSRNWMLAEGESERQRARESAVRHFFLWYNGNVDEDHASACFFNINLVEYLNESKEFREESRIRQGVLSEESRKDHSALSGTPQEASGTDEPKVK